MQTLCDFEVVRITSSLKMSGTEMMDDAVWLAKNRLSLFNQGNETALVIVVACRSPWLARFDAISLLGTRAATSWRWEPGIGRGGPATNSTHVALFCQLIISWETDWFSPIHQSCYS